MGNDENTWREEGIPKIRSSCILCTTAKHPKLLEIVPSPNQRAKLRRSNAIGVLLNTGHRCFIGHRPVKTLKNDGLEGHPTVLSRPDLGSDQNT